MFEEVTSVHVEPLRDQILMYEIAQKVASDGFKLLVISLFKKI